MLNKLLSRRRNVYIFALIAIFIESFSAVCLKMAGLYPVISTKYIFYFFIYFVSFIWLSFTFKCRNPTKTIGHYNEKCPITGCFGNFSRYPDTPTIRCVQKRP